MRGWKLALLLTVGTGIAACDVEQAENDQFDAAEIPEPAAESPQPATPAEAPTLTADFEAPEDAEGARDVAGTVRIFPSDGAAATAEAEQGFRVEVELEGLSQGEHAWHIHDAPCAEQGGIVVAMTETNDEDGIARPLSTTADDRPAQGEATVPADQLTLDQLRSGEYSLHVHARGGTDHGPTQACADLSDDTDDLSEDIGAGM